MQSIRRLSEDELLLSRPPVLPTAHCLEVNASVRLVCSAGECGQVLLAAEAGFVDVSDGLQGSVFDASARLAQQLLQRLRPWIQEEFVGHRWHIDSHWVIERLQSGCAIFPKRKDGPQPPYSQSRDTLRAYPAEPWC
ncbi:unnamed protein product [Effrenium voratum]|nr:unnamed protein product [Effrenium voratum]